MDKGEYAHRVNFLHSVGRSQESLPNPARRLLCGPGRHGGGMPGSSSRNRARPTVSQRYLARYRHAAATASAPHPRWGGCGMRTRAGYIRRMMTWGAAPQPLTYPTLRS